MTTEAQVPVTQADREAAQELHTEIVRQLGPRPNLSLIEDGDFDVRLLARHRATARRDALEEAARVVDEHGQAWGLAYRSMTDTLSGAIRNLAKEPTDG